MKTDQFLHIELPLIHTELRNHFNIDNSRIDHFTFDYDFIDLLELLNHICCEKIFYFKSKYKDFSFLGLGVSQTINGSDLNQYLTHHPDSYLTTSFSFEENPMTAEFTLPEWTFITQNGKTKLHVQKSFEYKNFSAPNLFFNLNFDLNHYDPFIPPWTSYEELPEHDQWTSMIDECNSALECGELLKIVMSRKKIFEYSEPIEPIAFFKSLIDKNSKNNSYQIFSQTFFGSAFLSITPEQLFSIQDNIFESISLAGSAARGKTPEDDQILEDYLKTSDKLIREHKVVTDEITKLLTPLSQKLMVYPLEIMKLPYIQHRAAHINALLKEHIKPLELIHLLHPTPAVGGLPWSIAKNKIAELEPYKRGSYAAPIGVISARYSELAVGIRSAIIEREKLTIFGGAGIVKGSTPEEEWVETGVKMNPFLQVVNHE